MRSNRPAWGEWFELAGINAILETDKRRGSVRKSVV